MADIYRDGDKLAKQMLKSSSKGGFGQGTIVLVRATKGQPDPANPFAPVSDILKKETIGGAARGVSEKLVGLQVGDAVLVATDLQMIATVPKMGYAAGDTMTLDGVPITILHIEKIPAAGFTSAIKFFMRK